MLLFIFLLLAVFHKWQINAANKYLSAGDGEYIEKNYSSALKDFSYAASLDGEKNIIYQARAKRGEIFYKYGQFDKAREELFGALKEKKDDYRAYDILGDVYFGENRFKEAIGYYDQAIGLCQEKGIETRIRLKKAKGLMSQGEMDAASGILSSMYIGSNAENEEMIFYLGLIDFNSNYSLNDNLKKLESRDDFSWRIEQIKNFIEEYDGEKSKDYNNIKIASLYNLINEPWLAINRTKEVAKKNDLYRDAWIVLGKSQFIAGEYADSLGSFHKASELDKRDGEIYYWLKNVYERIENQKKADQYADEYEKFK